MERFTRGWNLAKKSFGVVRADSSLVTLTVLGGAAALCAALALGIPATILYTDDREVIATVLAVIGAYLATFAAVYFGVALAATAAAVLEGRDGTVADGLAVARARIRPIAGWALALLTVNLVISFIRERAGVAGEVLAGIAGVAWGLVTFLVVPVIALEGLGPVAALKRSGTLFKGRWGEQVTGNFAIGGIFALAGVVPAVILGFVGASIDNTAGRVIVIGIAVVIAVVAMVLARAVSAVFSVALYRFASGSGARGPFADAELEGAVRMRGRVQPGI